MLISYSRNFLFVHIDKAAGTSIQDALESYANPRTRRLLNRRLVWLGSLNRAANLYRQVEFSEHAPADTVRRCVPRRVYRSLFKFAFVRNPWDRLVSRYAYLLRNTEHPRHAFVSRLAGFEDYLEWEIRRGKMHQHHYVTDSTGRLIVDFIGRFENLHADFARVCEQLGVKAALPHANTSSHRDYRRYYTPATQERVAREFARDVELFGYDFS